MRRPEMRENASFHAAICVTKRRRTPHTDARLCRGPDVSTGSVRDRVRNSEASGETMLP